MATKKTAKPSQAYKGNGNHVWELVTAGTDQRYSDPGTPRTDRLRVLGGYIYRVRGSGPVFVPMPTVVKHKA